MTLAGAALVRCGSSRCRNPPCRRQPQSGGYRGAGITTPLFPAGGPTSPWTAVASSAIGTPSERPLPLPVSPWLVAPQVSAAAPRSREAREGRHIEPEHGPQLARGPDFGYASCRPSWTSNGRASMPVCGELNFPSLLSMNLGRIRESYHLFRPRESHTLFRIYDHFRHW